MGTTRIAAIAGGASLAAIGLWALADPGSFHRVVAPYPPYHEHLLHDVGAFQLGLGAVLLLAAGVGDALFAALGGVGLGAAAHAWAHVLDRGLGGRSSDPWVLGAAAALLLAAAAGRWKEVRGG